MSRIKLNPFRYGRPVPPKSFIGREDAIRVIFSRGYNGESTAIVGEPHIGKSSMLGYIADAQVQAEWLGAVAGRCAFIEIDCHLLPDSHTPADFWKQTLDRVERTFSDTPVQVQLGVVRQSGFGSFTLEGLFKLLGQRQLRVILLIDEFDTLLHHPNFNTAEFFGALRSLSARTDGLLLVTASRLSVAEMNRRSQEINPLGSPFFNTFTEVRLLPLHPKEIDLLLDQALAGTDVSLSEDDRAYVRRVSGRHPYLVQMAAAALFEVAAQGKAEQTRYEEATTMLRRWTDAHFKDLWRCLNEKAQAAMIILALAEMRGSGGRHKPNLGTLEQHDLELRWLADGGLIEPTDDGAPAATWRGGRWRISAESFARWIVDMRKWEQFTQAIDTQHLGDKERARRLTDLNQLLDAHRQRLRERELQAARLGISADPSINTEIEEIKRQIDDIERQIREQ